MMTRKCQLRCNWNRLGLITNRQITGLTGAPRMAQAGTDARS